MSMQSLRLPSPIGKILLFSMAIIANILVNQGQLFVSLNVSRDIFGL